MGKGAPFMSESTDMTSTIERAFLGLDREAAEMLQKVAVANRYPPGTALCREGDVADTLFIIVKGKVVVTRDLEGTDEDFVLGYMGSGQFFGEMGLITEETRAATVSTTELTEVLEITKEDFEKTFQASPAMARSILNTMIGIIRETDKRAIEDLEKRYQELAKAYEELEAAQADRIAKAALEAQMEVAAKAQRSLLPTHLPTVPGYQFAAQFEPARHIGGDFYDVRLLESGMVSVLGADVSDKGAHAALFMAVSRTLFMTEEQYHSEPVEVMQSVHARLIESSAYDMFVTALYGILNPATGDFRYVRGGHDEPIWVHAGGSWEFLGGQGRFLGLWPGDGGWSEEHITLKPGDVLVIYSDGVTDMRSPAGESFGEKRLAELVSNLHEDDADTITRKVYEAVQKHRGTAKAFDDFTLVVMRVDQPSTI